MSSVAGYAYECNKLQQQQQEQKKTISRMNEEVKKQWWFQILRNFWYVITKNFENTYLILAFPTCVMSNTNVGAWNLVKIIVVRRLIGFWYILTLGIFSKQIVIKLLYYLFLKRKVFMLKKKN